MDQHEPEKNRHCKLKLYNTDRSEESAELALRLGEAVRAACNGICDIEVIDVLQAPEEAVRAHVFATPMLVKELPEPIQRVLGNLRDSRQVLMLLDMEPDKVDGK